MFIHPDVRVQIDHNYVFAQNVPVPWHSMFMCSDFKTIKDELKMNLLLNGKMCAKNSNLFFRNRRERNYSGNEYINKKPQSIGTIFVRKFAMK